jgi:mannose-6-phosphate isomerase-like protein (cupin superfamily)
VELFKKKVAEFVDPNRTVVIDQAYKRDLRGYISDVVTIPPGRLRVLVGRYSLHPEIQLAWQGHAMKAVKVLLDAPQQLRLKRVSERASSQAHREPEEQRRLIRQTVDPDWFKYFPSIFPSSDWYVVNYSSLPSVFRRPADCIDRSHVWGAFANLHIEPERIFRLVEIGKGGATSIHMHRAIDEAYLHVSGGRLGVTIGRGSAERTHVLVPGESLTVPRGTFHQAFAVDGDPPVYYETMSSADGSEIDSRNVERLSPARPMSGSLSYFASFRTE